MLLPIKKIPPLIISSSSTVFCHILNISSSRFYQSPLLLVMNYEIENISLNKWMLPKYIPMKLIKILFIIKNIIKMIDEFHIKVILFNMIIICIAFDFILSIILRVLINYLTMRFINVIIVLWHYFSFYHLIRWPWINYKCILIVNWMYWLQSDKLMIVSIYHIFITF